MYSLGTSQNLTILDHTPIQHISNAISYIVATLDYYHDLKNKEALPQEYHTVGEVLPPVRDILRAFKKHISQHPGIDIEKAYSIIGTFDIDITAIHLRDMFYIVRQSGKEPCATYLKAALKLSKGVPVESVMTKILGGVQHLVDDHLVDMVSEHTKAIATVLPYLLQSETHIYRMATQQMIRWRE